MTVLIPPVRNQGLEDVAYWEDFLTPEELKFLYYTDEWQTLQDAQIGGVDTLGQVNPHIRNSSVCWMSKNEKNAVIWDKIVNTICEVNRRFFQFDLTGCYEPAQLTLYTGTQQGKYNWHTDASNTDSGIPRKLSMTLLLSDTKDFQGGDLEFMVSSDQIQIAQQKLGRAWFFPSWMLHRVTPVTSGVRKSLVLWIGGPQFK
jgi:PKHD-type hydroxylase